MRNPVLMSFVALGAFVVAGCATRVQIPVSSVKAPERLATGSASDAAAERDWWRQFDDPVLDGLVAEAIDANRDLRAAAARFAAATELAGAARLAQLPSGGATVGALRQHLSEAEVFGRDLPSRTFSMTNAGTVVSWEADVFGRLRGRARAAAADARALELDARGVQVALAAQVAGAYFDLRGAARELELLEDMRRRTSELITRTSSLVAAGRLTRLDLLRVRQVDDELAADSARVTHLRERARLRLATLTGRTGEAWSVPDAPPAAFRTTLLPVGAAAALLDRRPDVGAAHLRLRAAAERAGVARADLLPRVEISGTLGLVAGSTGALTDASAVSWLVAPRLLWAFLDWPQLKRRIRAADALTDAAFAEYEATILRAIEDVQVAIDAYAAATAALQATERRSGAAAGAATVVSVQYREGLVDSLAATLAERDAIAGGLAWNRALVAQRQAVVSVYRALGGGW